MIPGSRALRRPHQGPREGREGDKLQSQEREGRRVQLPVQPQGLGRGRGWNCLQVHSSMLIHGYAFRAHLRNHTARAT